MKRFLLSGLVALLLATLALPVHAADDLKIEREGGGIRIIQKNPRPPRPPKTEQEAAATEEGGAPGDKNALPEEETTPEDEGDGVREEGAGPESRKDDQEKQDQGEQDDKDADSAKDSLENNPEYVEQLNELTREYNADMQRLQREADLVRNQYGERIEKHRRNITMLQQNIEGIRERPATGEMFRQSNERYDILREELAQMQREWNRRRSELQASADQRTARYEQDRQQLRNQFLQRREDQKKEQEEGQEGQPQEESQS